MSSVLARTSGAPRFKKETEPGRTKDWTWRPGSQLAQRLWLPPGTKVGLKKCCRLMDIFWNFNLITCSQAPQFQRPGVL